MPLLAITKHFISHRPRVSIAFLFGVGSFILLPSSLDMITRALLAWNVAVLLYLILVAILLSRSHEASLLKVAKQEDGSALAILVILSLSALSSLVAIVFELNHLSESDTAGRILRYGFTFITVVGSWLLLAVVFMFHYVFLFYTSPQKNRALAFPDHEENPDYWDFLYFSFTIAVALQTSDVMVMSRTMRKTVLVHSILSFLFNAAILGFSINIAASLVNG